MNLEHALDALVKEGFFLMDDFLESDMASSLRDQADKAYQNADFQPARIGHGKTLQQMHALRRDKILWLKEPALCSHEQQHYQALVWEYARACNQRFFLGLQEFECHYAIYEAGDFYRKHRDAFQDSSRRKLSTVYYINPDWLPEHGGELVLYGDNNRILQKIAPKFNRFILFDSQIEHEVLPTSALRYSITGWLKTAL